MLPFIAETPEDRFWIRPAGSLGSNTIAYSTAELGTALGFAIPVDFVNRIVPQLIKAGRIATPGIGIIRAMRRLR